MATATADYSHRAESAARPRRGRAARIVAALAIVLVIQGLFALCLVSALQLLAPRNMPFGVVGTSPVVSRVLLKAPGSLHVLGYPSQSAAMHAIDQSQAYGAYVAGSSHDTLILAPAKSFFARVDLEAAFAAAARQLHHPLTVQVAKPLPPNDPVGGVVGLLMLPVLIGGYLAAVLVFKAAGSPKTARWRVAILTGFAVVGAVLTDLIAGPWLGAYSNSHFWPLLPCLALVSIAVALAAAAIQALAGQAGTLLVVILFIFLGGAASGGNGVAMLPVYWQNIGAWLPPQSAVRLFRNVIYFGGNNITTPLIVLILYAVAGAAVIGYLEWIRPALAARAAATARAGGEAARAGGEAARAPGEAGATGRSAGNSVGARGVRAILAAGAICAIMECLFALNYMSSGHQPVATNMPFGATASSPILTAAQKGISLKVTHYPNKAAVKDAIDQSKIYGGLIPGATATAPATLIVVPSISDLAPLNLADQFARAAKAVRQPLKIQAYTPVPLAPKDPDAIVISLMMVPLFVGGYVAASALKTAAGTASGRWRGMILAGYAIVAGLVVALIAGPWLQGYPTSSFWLVWPILSLVIAAVALVCAVLQKLLGAAGTLLTVIVIMLLGNPSSGGANGVPYLNGFWGPLGPFLPPRNAYLLLRNTVYFHGHGITQPLLVLLAYFLVAAVAIGLLDWFRSPQIPVTPETVTDAAAMATPAGALQ